MLGALVVGVRPCPLCLRYAAYAAGVTTVMCGTIGRDRIEQDIAFVERGPLPEHTILRLGQVFRNIAESIGN